MAERISQIIEHLRGNPLTRLQSKSPDDVVIVLALRTPLCKARRGGFRDTSTDRLLLRTFQSFVSRLEDMSVPISSVEDVTVGSVLGEGGLAYKARAAALAAGLSEKTPIQIVNRFCSSGLMAVSVVANQIRNREIECGLALGFESMTNNPDKGAGEAGFDGEISAVSIAADCLQPMGWTSENVAGQFGISRESMDLVALRSHQRASRARASGLFREEIVPILADFITGEKDGVPVKEKRLVDEDDGIRDETTLETLKNLRPAFPNWPPSRTTAGNASQITDGASYVLLMSRRKAVQLNCKILGKYVQTQVIGLEPRIMGIGPSLAIPRLLEKVGLKIDDIDLFEINEAFASMYVYCLERLNLDINKVNVNGGAIALGHPLGCTGTRLIVTGLSELRRRKLKVMVVSMCIGLGMGAAGLVLAEYD
ncbi:Thiolase, N-terminal domain-containing protein [Phakopsora pachyrhizi]|uniref:Thiolase, N-terminal domain-domain-containing protein n=1 Tax=Phakopsora pachyrhizi TaxID=170000 RepID=A0AAV0BI48_PHAPC|nr:Thiolase, N-terminal domain-containing protein [Phakopsora pachyrhizi]CAH7686245.1 Thiolase, N-terminal domain-domain-containing protein [Phakopsora pachyrhizi]